MIAVKNIDTTCILLLLDEPLHVEASGCLRIAIVIEFLGRFVRAQPWLHLPVSSCFNEVQEFAVYMSCGRMKGSSSTRHQFQQLAYVLEIRVFLHNCFRSRLGGTLRPADFYWSKLARSSRVAAELKSFQVPTPRWLASRVRILSQECEHDASHGADQYYAT